MWWISGRSTATGFTRAIAAMAPLPAESDRMVPTVLHRAGSSRQFAGFYEGYTVESVADRAVSYLPFRMLTLPLPVDKRMRLPP